MKKVLSVLAISLLLTACGGGSSSSDALSSVDDEGITTLNTGEMDAELTRMDYEQVSADEEADLIFLREEEKVARDAYLAMYEVHGTNIFNNIADAEQTHTDTVKILLDKYSIADPVTNDTVGVFSDSDLQAIYDALVASGSESLEAAIKVGLEVEELDIADIRTFRVRADNEDILAMLDELEKGSRNHLRSYWKLLNSKEFTYMPSHLSQEAFDEIVNSEMENGQ